MLKELAINDDMADWWVPPDPKMVLTPTPSKAAVPAPPPPPPAGPTGEDDPDDPLVEGRKGARVKPITPEEKHLLTKFGNLARYLEVREGSNMDKLRYLKDQWTVINRTLFGGQLKPCTLEVVGSKSNFKLRASWNGYYRKLCLSARLFNAPEEVVLNIIVHEMCHQAVTDISQTIETVERGHGPIWKGWMVKVGVSPERYDRYGNDMYESDTELTRKEAKKKAAPKGLWLSRFDIYSGLIVRVKMKNGIYKPGVVIRPDPKQVDKWHVLLDPFKPTIVRCEHYHLYEYEGANRAMYESPLWQKLVTEYKQSDEYKKLLGEG